MSLKDIAKRFKQELAVYRLALQDPRTPRLAKLCFWMAISYALMPFDLIPDFIPVIGHLDDLIIVPAFIYMALKLTPPEIIADCRRQAKRP